MEPDSQKSRNAPVRKGWMAAMQHKRRFRLLGLFLCLCLLLCSCAQQKEQPMTEPADQDYIKWIDFDIPEPVLTRALKLDVESVNSDCHVGWVELLSLWAARNGGSFEDCRPDDLQKLYDARVSGKTAEKLASNTKLYSYYTEAYGAVLGGMVGYYTEVRTDENGKLTTTECYGLRAFSPLAAGYHYTDYDDFGAARSYGYRRNHLGHDLLGSIGTPVVAVESGYIEHLGWNQYGGWRVGIRSLDGKRYYYYAHLRKNTPYADGLEEGQYVCAGEVIGYLGMTGYSVKENVNGINTPHLHFGLQIIFDQSQIDGWNQIWIDLYDLTHFLAQNRAPTRAGATAGKRVSTVYYLYPEQPD